VSGENLRIVVTTDSAGVVIATLAGEFDIVAAEQLRDLLCRLLAEYGDTHANLLRRR
jgi:hypothetical protein